MTSRTPHGDDWIEVLGGVLFGLITFTLGLLTLAFQFIRWLMKKATNS